MDLRNGLIPVLCFVLLAGCGRGKTEKTPEKIQEPSASGVSGNISISGAFALAPMAKKLADDFMKLHQGIKIEIVETGTGKGLDALIEKKVQLAMLSRPLTDEEREAGIWVVPVAKDGVAPIVNQKNPYLDKLLTQGLSPDEFQKLFTAEKPVKWSDLLGTTGPDNVMVFARADESGAADMLARFLFKSSADFRGTKVTGDHEMIKAVQSNKMAIGFCNFSYAFNGENGERTDNIQVVPFDLDYDNDVDRKETPFENLEAAHRSVWLGFYPDMLCRELTFGSLGKPTDPAVIEFLRYVLTEGQEEIKNSGLCKLNDVYVKSSLELIE